MRFPVLCALLGLFVTSLAGCAPQEQPPPKQARLVEVVPVTAAPVSETVSTTGEIRARIQSDLSFRVSGRITERLADVGDRVKAGQVLARIDPQEQKADLEVALATVTSAEAQETQAQQSFDRQERLFSTGVTTRAALDEAQAAILRARATVETAKAQLDTARDALRQTELKADADGVITARNAETGQVAQAAQLIFTLAHDGPRDAVINVDEALLLGRPLEDDVQVKPLSGGKPIKANVREVSPTIDTAMGTVRVKLGLEDAADVGLGSVVLATAHLRPETMIQLPWSALTSKAGRPAVWVVDPATRAVAMRPVDVSSYGAAHFSVRGGVTPGELVVAKGMQFLSDGEVVTYKGAAR